MGDFPTIFSFARGDFMKVHKEYRSKQKKIDQVEDKEIIFEKRIETVPRDQTNTQENQQDMDQSQNVDVKPAQFVSVIVNNQIENFTGKITGYVHKETIEEIRYPIRIVLYFGNHKRYPIYQKILDENMDFVVEELPPGFYMIELYSKDKLIKKIPNIKLLPNQTVYQSIIAE